MRQFNAMEDMMGVLRRRLALVLAIVAVGAALSAIYAISLPRLYETTAVIQIELPEISEDASRPTTASRAKHRLQLIEQQLMARDSLLSVISEHGLFASTSRMSDLDRVTAMRKSVRIEQIVDNVELYRPDAVPTGLLITVQLGDPEKAAAVANSFLTRILDQSQSRREEQVSQALSFFEGEVTRVGAKIVALEADIADFKRVNAASMPAGIASLRDQMTILRSTEIEIESQIVSLKANSSRTREDVLTRQVGELDQQKQLIQSRIGLIEEAIRAAPQVERNYSVLARELQQLQDQFSVITRRKAEAEMGQMLESNQQAERFEVLETALVPENPVSPSRKKIVLLGTFLAAMLASGLVIVMEMMNPVIRTSSQMEHELGILPIVAIPKIGTKWRRKRWTLAWIGAIATAVLVALPYLQKWVGKLIESFRQTGGTVGNVAKP